ncbi:MAG TPA: hypothetical protein VG929_00515 [Actinomycetota bacterium]|nr:hypothetical protein [Actinomycetota bacterium]
MKIRRISAGLVAMLLVFAGCGGDDAPTATEDPAAQERVDENDDGASKNKKARRKHGTAPEPKGKRFGANRTDAQAETEGDDGSDNEETAEDDGSSRYAPAPGVYTYAQEGFEEFCDATSCSRETLPARQTVKTYYEGTRGDGLVVVTEARSSHNRLTKTTTLHAPDRARITKVHVRLSYEGFSFTNTYRPDPPVEAMRYPLREGDRWSGSWKDSTSGDYDIRVGGKEAVQVDGGTVQAFRVRTTTTFRGEIQGRGDVTVWIDPATAAVVKSEGRVELESVFGRYNTTFSATLQDGPEYR